MKSKAIKLDGSLHLQVSQLANSNKRSRREELDYIVKDGLAAREILKSPYLKHELKAGIKRGDWPPDTTVADVIKIMLETYFMLQDIDVSL